MKNRVKVLVIGLAFLMIYTGMFLSYRSGTFLMFVWASDSYGDTVRNVAVYYTNDVLVNNFTTSGSSSKVNDSLALNFEVWTEYNVTFASTNATAQTYTKLNVTITFVSNSSALSSYNNITTTQVTSNTYNDSQVYYIEFYFNWTTQLTYPGLSYNVTFNYQPYY